MPKKEEVGNLTYPFSKAQQMQLASIGYCTFFYEEESEQIINELIEHHELWHSCIMVNDSSNMFTLRDLPKNVFNANTLYIVVNPSDEPYKLYHIANRWKARPAQIGFITNKTTLRECGIGENSKRQLLRIYWD